MSSFSELPKSITLYAILILYPSFISNLYDAVTSINHQTQPTTMLLCDNAYRDKQLTKSFWMLGIAVVTLLLCFLLFTKQMLPLNVLAGFMISSVLMIFYYVYAYHHENKVLTATVYGLALFSIVAFPIIFSHYGSRTIM